MIIVSATQNPGKLAEIRTILAELPVTVQSAAEASIAELPGETGETFEENALSKARLVSRRISEWALADDAGICFRALGGQPGVRTARWAGPDATDEDRVRNALEKMKHVPAGRRQATFHSVIALVAPDGQEWVFSARVNGRLATEPRGTAKPKLPFDTLFIPDGYELTFAEMDEAAKNAVSHRGQALRNVRTFLHELLELEAFP